MIATLTDIESELTIHKVSGDINVERLFSSLRILKETATRRVLWNLNGVSNIARSRSAATGFIEACVQDIPVLAGGKTAFVFSSATDYGIGRMYETYAKMENLPFEMAMFQSMAEAENWLSQ